MKNYEMLCEQKNKEFFNNESIYFNVFYYDKCNYLSKDKFESLIEFLNKHKNLFESMNIARKKLVFEPEQQSNLLDEKNIRDL